jgi:hypothetical protein
MVVDWVAQEANAVATRPARGDLVRVVHADVDLVAFDLV